MFKLPRYHQFVDTDRHHMYRFEVYYKEFEQVKVACLIRVFGLHGIRKTL